LLVVRRAGKASPTPAASGACAKALRRRRADKQLATNNQQLHSDGADVVAFRKNTAMRRSVAIVLLVLGLAIVAYGLMKKDDQQATIDLGKTEIDIGKSDSAFNGYFIFGGLAAVVGLVMLATGKRA
jgi:uncharacterized membrane protein YidH (DUF202 family)